MEIHLKKEIENQIRIEKEIKTKAKTERGKEEKERLLTERGILQLEVLAQDNECFMFAISMVIRETTIQFPEQLI